MSPTPEEVLARRYPSFHEPLRLVRRWNRSDSPPELEAAARVLPELMHRYPAALGLWYEAALNALTRKDRPGALDLLARIDRQFGGRLNEDTHALWGRCYKDAGHEHLKTALVLTPGAARNLALEDADREYARALAQYLKGLELGGGPFSAVNGAFLEFMRAALAAALGRSADQARLLAAAQQRAADLLRPGPEWPRTQPDDDVWHPATRGEACALLGRWDEAVGHYDQALSRPTVQPFHPGSMGRQLKRVIQGWGLLGQPAPADLDQRLFQLSEFLK